MDNVPAPPEQSSKPDRYTGKAPFTHGDGDGQVFHFERWGICYGTDDRGHAAAVILSVLLIVALLVCIIAACIITNSTTLTEIVKYIGTALVFVMGVAVGKSGGNNSRPE